MYKCNICQTIFYPTGGFAFQISAYDLDNDPLLYYIQGSNAIYFDVNKQTGEVTIKNQLDREVVQNTISLFFIGWKDKFVNSIFFFNSFSQTNELFPVLIAVHDGVYPSNVSSIN